VDIVESARFTPVELAAPVAEAVSWWKQQREKFLPYGIPLSDAQQTQLKPFFAAELVDQVRIVKLPQTGESIPYQPFYEKFLATGPSIMPFFDVAVFNDEPPPRAVFHTLVHITQLALIGPERVLEAYLRTLNDQGCGQVFHSWSRPTIWTRGTQETPPTASRWKRKFGSGYAADGILKSSHLHWDVQSGQLRAGFQIYEYAVTRNWVRWLANPLSENYL
jgi:hypothetical protein